jgi:hypothetical protein
MTRSIPRRFAAVTLAIMLVIVVAGSGVGPSPVGSAEAAGPLADCSWYDSTYGGFTTVMLQTISGTGCTIGDDAEPGTAAMGDVYASATTLQSTQDTALSMVDNRLTDARGPAYAEAKIAMAGQFKAGANKSVSLSSNSVNASRSESLISSLLSIRSRSVSIWSDGAICNSIL